MSGRLGLGAAALCVPGRVASGCLAAFATATLAGACNAITGETSYVNVFCTAAGLSSCESVCEGKGGRWQESTSTCSCSGGAPLCGRLDDDYGGCCSAEEYCTTDPQGHRFCQECGEPCGTVGGVGVCCGPDEKCLNEDAGVCEADYGKAAQSCGGGLACPIPTLDGTRRAADCCESIALAGGAFPMGRSLTGTDQCPAQDVADGTCEVDELPEEEVTLSPYALDRFEVTVGRFRRFVASWEYKGLPAGAGANLHVSGSGWESDWNSSLPATREKLEKDLACVTDPDGPMSDLATWTHTAGPNENRPINCVTFYEAFAFCAWDGGRLPTEAEWESAAANGSRNDLYPWGEALPAPTLAVYDCAYDPTPCAHPPSLPADVGSSPGGANRAGHRDLAGNVLEWTRDSIGAYPSAPSINYALIVPGYFGFPVVRGGGFGQAPDALRAAARASRPAAAPSPGIGIRCARNG